MAVRTFRKFDSLLRGVADRELAGLGVVDYYCVSAASARMKLGHIDILKEPEH